MFGFRGSSSVGEMVEHRRGGGAFAESVPVGRMLLVTEHTWAPPEHPDPPENQPLGIEADDSAVTVDGFPAVWVRVEFTRTWMQRLPGFVERAAADRVFVQLVHMGFPHHVWLPRERVTHRQLKPRRDK